MTDNQGVQLARRGFLRLISALPAFAVFRSLPVQAAPVSEAYPRWVDRRVKVAANDLRRIIWAPYGQYDWIELPAYVVSSLAVSEQGVSFHCADGCLRHLQGNPADLDTWSVRAVADVWSL